MINRFFFIFSCAIFLARSGNCLTPEEVSQFSTAKATVYLAYARALAYMPDKVSTGLQRSLSLWAYDPNGNSTYGDVRVTIDVNGTALGRSDSWSFSPWVNGAVNNSWYSFSSKSLHGISGALRYYGYNTSTKGTQITVTGTTCSSVDYGTFLTEYATHWDKYTSNTCSNLRASCIIGESAVFFQQEDWWSQSYQLGQSYWGIPGYGSGSMHTYQIINACSPVVPVDEFSNFRSLPLPDSYLIDTSDIISTLKLVANNPDAFPLDRADASAALNVIASGVAVPSGSIPPGTSAGPATVWNLEGSGGVLGGGGGGAAVITATANVNVTVNMSTAEIVAPLDDIKNYISSGTVPNADSFDYDDLTAPMVSKSTGILAAYLVNITSAPFFTSILSKFDVFESTQPAFPCVPFDVEMFNVHEQICLEETPWYSKILEILRGLVLISAFMYSCKILYKGSAD